MKCLWKSLRITGSRMGYMSIVWMNEGKLTQKITNWSWMKPERGSIRRPEHQGRNYFKDLRAFLAISVSIQKGEKRAKTRRECASHWSIK